MIRTINSLVLYSNRYEIHASDSKIAWSYYPCKRITIQS